MPPQPKDLKIEDIAGVVIGVVLGTALFIALFIFIRQRRREKLLRAQIEEAATFTAAAYRTKSIGTEDEEMSLQPSDNSPSSMISRYSEAQDSTRSELNPYNYRMRPELATIKSSSRMKFFPDEKTGRVAEIRNCPHELEAYVLGTPTAPKHVKLADHVMGEQGDGSESESESPVKEMKQVRI